MMSAALPAAAQPQVEVFGSLVALGRTQVTFDPWGSPALRFGMRVEF